MSNDQLRLVATIEDKFTGPLSRLKQGVASIGDETKRQTGAWRKDWEGVRGEVSKFQGVLGAMNPALSAIGIGSLAAATSLGGAVTALRSFSKETQGLSILSRQTGIAIDGLRALESLGKRVGLSGDAMLNAADTFARAAVQFKRGWHEAVKELPAMNLDWLARDLKAATSVEDMMNRLLTSLPKVSNLEARRRVMVMFFGTEDIDKIIQEFGDKTVSQLNEIRQNIGKLSPEMEKAARDFEKHTGQMADYWERLKIAIGGPLLKGVVEGLKSGDRNGIRGNEEAMTGNLRDRLKKAEEQRDFLSSEAGGGAGKNGDRLKSLEREIRNLTEELKKIQNGQAGSVSAIPMSFTGLMGGNPLIQKAGFGYVGPFGGGYGGGYGGYSGGPPPIPRSSPLMPADGDHEDAPRGAGRGAPRLRQEPSLSGRRPRSRSSPDRYDGPLTAKYPDGLAAGIRQTAKDLGVSAEDIATAISYETAGTFNKWKRGPTTKWGQHRGLIQWGKKQRDEYGVTEDMSAGEQMKAVTQYLRRAGVKPGMGLLDIYSAINAGRVGKYNASDAAAGGAWGTVRDKVEHQMHGHRRKAQALLKAHPDDGVAEGGSPAPRRQADPFMQRFFDRGGGAAVARGPMTEAGKGTLHLRFENAPKGLKVDHEMDGLFRAVTTSRHRSSEMTDL